MKIQVFNHMLVQGLQLLAGHDSQVTFPTLPYGLLTDRAVFSSMVDVIVSIPNHRSQFQYYTLAISIS